MTKSEKNPPEMSYQKARDLFDQYKKVFPLSPEQTDLYTNALDTLIRLEPDPQTKNIWRFNRSNYYIEDRHYAAALALLDAIDQSGGLPGVEEQRDYIRRCQEADRSKNGSADVLDRLRAMDEAWDLYHEYLDAPEPDAGQIFMAQEALDYMITHYTDELDRNVARYNLAEICVENREYNRAIRLLEKIRSEDDVCGAPELLAEIYLYADAENRDNRKAIEILLKEEPGLNRNLLLYQALRRSPEGLDLDSAIDLIEPILGNGYDNEEIHPLWAVEACLYSSHIDFFGFSHIQDGEESLDEADRLYAGLSEKELKTPRAKSLGRQILETYDWLEEHKLARADQKSET